MGLNDLFTYEGKLNTLLSSHEETVLTPQGLSLLPKNSLYLPFHGGTESHLGVLPTTESGGIIYPSYLDRIAIQLAEATTNSDPNPSFEVNVTDGYNWDGKTDAARAHITTDAKVGSACCKLTEDSTPANPYALWINDLVVAGSSTWTFSIQVKDIDSNAVPYFWIRENDGSTTTTQVNITNLSTTAWKFYTITVTMQAGTTATDFGIRSPGHAGQGSILVDAWQIEQKAYPTPYCDGSLGEGHTWSGTEHASTSSRVKTSLAYTLDLPSEFSIEFWHTPHTLESEHTGYACLWMWHYDSDNMMAYYVDPSADRGYIAWRAQGTTSYYSFDAEQWVRGIPIHYAITFDGTTIKTYVDSLPKHNAPPTQPAFATIPDVLYVGATSAFASQSNGFLYEFIVLDYALTADEVEVLYEQGLPGLFTRSGKLFSTIV